MSSSTSVLGQVQDGERSPLAVTITVFAADAGVATFAQRVRSWFNDGTTVSVEGATLSAARLAPAAQPNGVNVWVIVRSRERALVTFSMRAANGAECHLVREVRLRDGLDELGLERLASLIQSTVVALREGLEGTDRDALTTELRDAGVTLVDTPPQSTPQEPGHSEKSDQTAARADRPSLGPTQSVVRRRAVAPSAAPSEGDQPTDPPSQRGFSPLFELSYGMRYGGTGALLHGPALGFGWPYSLPSGAVWLSIRAGLFVPQSVKAPPFRLSLQTSWARAALGFESGSLTRVSWYGALHGGADVARIGSQVDSDTAQYAAFDPATRVWGQLGLLAGLWFRTAIDFGVTGVLDYRVTDVRYVVESDTGERTVLSAARWQPALFVSGRFGVTQRD